MFKSTALIFLLMTPLLTFAQQVSTLVDSMNASGGVSVGPDGNIYVADFGNLLSNADGTAVYKVTPQGLVTAFATGFNGASGNDFDASGNLIQANISASRIDQVSPTGVRTTISSSGLNGPVGVAVAANGDIFVANCGGNSISRISNGMTSSFVTGSGLSCPNGLTFDPDGNLYAINFNNGGIYKIDPQGQIALIATTPGSTFRPSGGNGHIVYGNGRMYLTSNGSSKIYEMTLDGQLTVLAGSGALGTQDGPADQATFSLPNGIAISPDGRFLYVNSALSSPPGPLNGNTFPLNPSALRVIDLGPSFTINAGLNDAWYNPATNGQGFLISVFPVIKQVFVAWFTYDTERPPDDVTAFLGEPGHRWLTAQGSFEGNTANLTVFVTEGGVFDSATPAASTDPAGDGTITLEFADCTEAMVTYEIASLGISGEIPVQRVVEGNMDLCEALASPSP